MDSTLRIVDIVPYALAGLSVLMALALFFLARKFKKSTDVEAEENRRKAAEAAAKGNAAVAESLRARMNSMSAQTERAKRDAAAAEKRQAEVESELRVEKRRKVAASAAKADFRFSAAESLKGWFGLSSRFVPAPASENGICEKKDFFFRFQLGFLELYNSGALGSADGEVANVKRAVWSGDFRKIAAAIAAAVVKTGADASDAYAQAERVVRSLAVAALRGAAGDAGIRCPYETVADSELDAVKKKVSRYEALFKKIAAGLPLDADDVMVHSRFNAEKELDAEMARIAGKGRAYVVDLDRDARALSIGVALSSLFSNGFANLSRALAEKRNISKIRFLL